MVLYVCGDLTGHPFVADQLQNYLIPAWFSAYCNPSETSSRSINSEAVWYWFSVTRPALKRASTSANGARSSYLPILIQ